MEANVSVASGMDHSRHSEVLGTQDGVARAVRLVVHLLGDGRLAPSVFHRTWRGREAWDRRLSPSGALEAPPAPPHGMPVELWVIVWAVGGLVRRQGYALELRPLGRPESPSGGLQGGSSTDTATRE